MEILDEKLIEYSPEKASTFLSSKPNLASTKIGNVAGYVKDRNGNIVPFMTITRVANNTQTISHQGGDFIVVSVHEGELLRFQKDGYEILEYRVRASDFENLIEIIIEEG